jgi:rhodanese-related sulfurtransferase
VVPFLECQELFSRLGDEEVLVLDCREPDDWLRFELHVPGALRMTLRELEVGAHALPDDELIVLCGCAEDASDVKRAFRLLQMRGREAVCLAGGLLAWVRGGYPTERHSAQLEGPEASR